MATKEEEERSMTVLQLMAFLETCQPDSPVTIENMGSLPALEIVAAAKVPRVRPAKDEAVLSIREQRYRYQIQFRGTWGGQASVRWRPASARPSASTRENDAWRSMLKRR